MAKDHFIPATLLGRFSENEVGSFRSRELQIVSVHTERRTAKAGDVGYKSNLYNVDPDLFPASRGRAIDQLWNAYEPDLSRALDSLIDGYLTAPDWIKVLVPWIAATFARDRFYSRRVEGRLKNNGLDDDLIDTHNLLDKTNVNVNRVVEMNRFAARAIMCNWHVYETDGDLIIPDLGFGFDLLAPFQGKDVVGLMLPIGKRHLLELAPAPERVLAVRTSGNEWKIPISYSRSDATSARLNSELAKCGQDFIAGSSAATGPLSKQDLAIFGPEDVDQLIHQWPYNVDTLMLAGIHIPITELLEGGDPNLDSCLLDRLEGISQLEPAIDMRIARTATRAPASCFISKTDAEIVVRAHANN